MLSDLLNKLHSHVASTLGLSSKRLDAQAIILNYVLAAAIPFAMYFIYVLRRGYAYDGPSSKPNVSRGRSVIIKSKSSAKRKNWGRR